VNTISLLLLYRIKSPENFFLLRGNDEAAAINRMCGFFDECKRDYSTRVWEMFEWLPIAAMIDNRILCVHGGIGPDLHSLEQLRSIKRPLDMPECDLTWADPEPSCESWGQSPRFTSCIFGERPVRQLLHNLGLDAMFRAHQAIARGYQFAFEPWQGVVTIFSAPNYGGDFGNYGAVVMVDSNNQCIFKTFEPKPLAVTAALLKRPQGPKAAADAVDDFNVIVRRFGNGP
jgi:serine/threonine-protein phosphatase PP1 catalytic subunit